MELMKYEGISVKYFAINIFLWHKSKSRV